jgi:hypothetical protein
MESRRSQRDDRPASAPASRLSRMAAAITRPSATSPYQSIAMPATITERTGR